jgi:hypothetical protein
VEADSPVLLGSPPDVLLDETAAVPEVVESPEEARGHLRATSLDRRALEAVELAARQHLRESGSELGLRTEVLEDDWDEDGAEAPVEAEGVSSTSAPQEVQLYADDVERAIEEQVGGQWGPPMSLSGEEDGTTSVPASPPPRALEEVYLVEREVRVEVLYAVLEGAEGGEESSRTPRGAMPDSDQPPSEWGEISPGFSMIALKSPESLDSTPRTSLERLRIRRPLGSSSNFQLAEVTLARRAPISDSEADEDDDDDADGVSLPEIEIAGQLTPAASASVRDPSVTMATLRTSLSPTRVRSEAQRHHGHSKDLPVADKGTFGTPASPWPL